MITKSKPLLAMTAGDLMSEDLVVIPKDMSLRAAARLLGRHNVSGAPVVDGNGRCIGILSATDFVHWAEQRGREEKSASPTAECFKPWQIVEPENLPDDECVSRYMTLDPVFVRPETHIGELARMMIDVHIHRVLVVDSDGQPIGLVSSTDILAAVAYAEHGAEVGHN